MANKPKLKGVRKNRHKKHSGARNRARRKKSVEERKCLRLKLKK